MFSTAAAVGGGVLSHTAAVDDETQGVAASKRARTSQQQHFHQTELPGGSVTTTTTPQQPPISIRLPATGPVDPLVLQQLPTHGRAFDALILQQSVLQDFSGDPLTEYLQRVTCIGRVDGFHAPISVVVDVPVRNGETGRTELVRACRPCYIATPPLPCSRAGDGYRGSKKDGTKENKVSFSLKVSCPLPRDGEKRTVGQEVKEGLTRFIERLKVVAYDERIAIFQRDLERNDIHLGKLVDWGADDGVEHKFPPAMTFKVETIGKGDAARPRVSVFDTYQNPMQWADIGPGDMVAVIASPVIWLFQGNMGVSLIATQIQVRRLVQSLPEPIDLKSLRQ